jgi:hypothetical protein
MAFGGSNRGKMLVEPSYGTSEALFCCCAVASTSLTVFQNNRTKNMLLRPVATSSPLLVSFIFDDALTPRNPPVIKGSCVPPLRLNQPLDPLTVSAKRRLRSRLTGKLSTQLTLTPTSWA